jgi:NitT/TauT family transport system permease protein
VFLGAVFALLINTLVGVKNVDTSLLRAAYSMGATDLQIFRTIVLPSSVPFILSGMRLGLGHALTGVVVGELYAATAGIGYTIAVAGNTLQTDKVFAGVAIIAFTGVVFTQLFKRIEDHFESWRPQRGF